MKAKKKKAQTKLKKRRVNPPQSDATREHSARFDQLLDDAIFGVTKKNPRG